MAQVEENLRLNDEADLPLSTQELEAIDKVVAILKVKNEIPSGTWMLLWRIMEFY